jgi:hypothetical protein
MQNGQAVTITLAPASGGHPHSLHAHPLLFFRLVEQHQAATAAAERAVAAALISTRFNPGIASSTSRGSS